MFFLLRFLCTVVWIHRVLTFVFAGGFGNASRPTNSRDSAAVAVHDVPERAPDASITEVTVPWQAALYRLNGDLNPVRET